MATVTKIDHTCVLGEAPHWDGKNLYLVDIMGKGILKYAYETGKVTRADTDKQPTFIIPVEGKTNEFVISLDNELVRVKWNGESDKITIIEKLASADKAFNDAKCDSAGRLWAGTHKIAPELAKTEPVGTLYTLDSKKQLKSQVDKIRIANGLAFNDNTKKMYYIDSLAGSVDQFDFDVQSGSVCNRTTWFTLSKLGISGIPDGMTIDTDGNLWVAVFGGSRVLKVAGNKCETLLDTIEIPAEQVTSVAFGGPDLDELYVTTGALEMGQKLTLSAEGATFKVTGTGAKGLPGVSFKLN